MNSENKKIVLIRERDVGLFSLILQVVNALQNIEGKPYTPIVYFGANCCYWVADGFNGKQSVWEYYFQPIVEGYSEDFVIPNMTNKDFLENCISTKDYYPEIEGHKIQHKIPFLQEVNQTDRKIGARIIEKYIRLTDGVQAKVDQFFAENLNDSYIIGVHVRGTDAIHHNLRLQDVLIDQYRSQIDSEIGRLEGRQDYKIYVATDDQKYIKQLEEFYGSKVVSFEAIRKKNDDEEDVGCWAVRGNYALLHITGLDVGCSEWRGCHY